MNILILNWRDPQHPLAGGAEISLLEHAKYWQKKGAHITWFASSFAGGKEKETLENIHIIRKGTHYTVYMWAFLYYLKGELRGFDRVIDCFHFIPFFTPFYMRQSKIIALIHEVAKDVWFQNVSFFLALVGSSMEPIFFRFYRKIPFITVSPSTKKDLIRWGIQKNKIEIIFNGIETPKIKKIPRQKDPTVLFLGRISQDKGIQDALKAYEVIQSHIPTVQMWIVGKEQKKGAMKNLLNSLKGVTYFGFVSEEKKYELLQQAWVVVHPSTREGWGLTVIEANSVGTPVVGYDVPGLRDSIMHNKTGLLVQPQVQDLASGVTKLLQDKKLWRRLSDGAKKWSQQFSWQKSTAQSWSMLKET